MEFITFEAARQQASANKRRIYTKTRGDGSSGFERSVEAAFPDIAVTPKFSVPMDTPVFTIGSCFARNVENSLRGKGFEIITDQCEIPGELYELEGLGARTGALNVYTPHAMRDILRWVERSDKETAGSLSLENDNTMDMLVSGLRPLSPSDFQMVRQRLLQTYRDLSGAGLVIITLGYTESWFDTVDKVFVNRSPAASRATLNHGDRFEFANAGAPEVIEALEEIVTIIRARTADRAKIVLTVSPVPLHGTFTKNDIICANYYSKYTLLSSAVLVSSRYDYVDYYPSFEMVTLSNPTDVWEADGIHVKSAQIAKVISKFADEYVDPR